MNIVILAGGSGSRLWPMSRKDRAKQFNELVGKKTMLEMTLDRFRDHYDEKDVYISTTQSNKKRVEEILPDFSSENIIVEPEMRDTAAAMGYVALWLSRKEPDEPVAFVASDHYIRNAKMLIRTLEVAEEEIGKTGKLVDISMIAECPSTALGYTKIGKLLRSKDGVEIYEFLGHREKPSFSEAQEFVESGDYLWHGNFYMWTPKLFLGAFKRYAPEIYRHLEKIGEILKSQGNSAKIKEEYAKIEKTSLDYAITEKIDAKNILIIKGEFGWSDIGTWDVLHKKLMTKADSKGNLIKGKWVGLDTTNSLIYASSNKLIATIGVNDMVIVDTPDALLVCPKGRAQKVKELVEKLKKKGESGYL
ncbi:MAG: sugar phosphate nucleotidyltransferase [Patescibacteria group bacterium]|nr:NTP transferase domain-containing protein [Patescibacteria group bacterium]